MHACGAPGMMSSVNFVGGCVRGRWERGGEHSQLQVSVDAAVKDGLPILEQVYAVWLWCSVTVWSSSMHGAVRRLNPGVPD
eukprot:5522506-Prymnesium_polylepis.1